MEERFKKLSKKELCAEFKEYLHQNNYSSKSIVTYSSQALFLFDKVGKDKFWEILKSNEYETIARQLIYNELVKSGTQKYTNCYLSNLRCFRKFCGITTVYNNREKIKSGQSITQNYKEKKYNPTLIVSQAIEAIQKYHYSIDSNYTRYKSWEHCYNAFKMYRHDKEKSEFLCLHLSCYLASWGMLRNSALINYDYLIHKDFVEQISDTKYDKLYAENFRGINLIKELIGLINNVYPDTISKTDTFITKILLGVFGCAPAYDRYFKKAVTRYDVSGSSFNEKSLMDLYSYYEMYFDEFEELRNHFSEEGVYYTPMKMMDMCFWQLGFDMENK